MCFAIAREKKEHFRAFLRQIPFLIGSKIKEVIFLLLSAAIFCLAAKMSWLNELTELRLTYLFSAKGPKEKLWGS
jgi:hypothetical protein